MQTPLVGFGKATLPTAVEYRTIGEACLYAIKLFHLLILFKFRISQFPGIMAVNIAFEELPLKKDGPFGNAWGRFG